MHYILGCEQRRGEVVLEPMSLLEPDPFAIVAGEIDVGQPRRYRRVRGRREWDLLQATDMTMLVSMKLVDDLRRSGITGWRTFPVVVEPALGTEYVGLVITGRLKIDHARSRRDVLAPRARGVPVPVWRGLHPLPGSWDGSDLALVDSTRIVMVTDKVQRLAAQDEWTNVYFERAADAVNYILWEADGPQV